MNKTKRVLSVVLAVLMLSSLIAALAIAEGQYTVVINYVFKGGKQAAPSWTATLAEGSNLEQTVTSPTVVGYKPDQATFNVSVNNITENKTYTVTYHPANVGFTVNHYLQNVADNNYTLDKTEEVGGFTESEVGDGLAKTTYPGFAALLYNTKAKVAADGSTVVEIYYDRNYYMMSFNLDGGYGVEPIYARYGASVKVENPTKPGYTFNGWEPTVPTTVPAENTTYKAKWTPGESGFTVVFWYENANDDGYSYAGSIKPANVAPGTQKSSGDYKDAAFTGRDDTHFTYNTAKVETVTVKGDGSTVLNVYFTRNIYSMRLWDSQGNKEVDVLTITAKYQQDISGYFPVEFDKYSAFTSGYYKNSNYPNNGYVCNWLVGYEGYLDKATGKPVVVNGVPTPDKTGETSDAIITEKFKVITGYMPDSYQKRLVLSATEAENVITFWYTKDDVHAPVQIVHWTQNIAGEGYTEYQSSTNLNGEIGQTYTGTPLTIPGFTYNAEKSNASGELTAEGLELNLYYDRVKYSYTVRYVDAADNNKDIDPEANVTGEGLFGAQVIGSQKEFNGYMPADNEPKQKSIIIGTGTNEIIFYYYPCYYIGHVRSGSLNNTDTIRLTGSKANLTEAVTPGYLYGGAFDDEKCETVYNFGQENAMGFTPVKGETYYIWEVNKNYLKPRAYVVSRHDPNAAPDANGSTLNVVGLYLTSSVDRNMYSEVGFTVDGTNHASDDGKVYDKVQAVYTDGSGVKEEMYVTAEGVWDVQAQAPAPASRGGYVSICTVSMNTFYKKSAESPLSYQPYWVTLDGIKVTGAYEARTCYYQGVGYNDVWISDCVSSNSRVSIYRAATTNTIGVESVAVLSAAPETVQPEVPVTPEIPEVPEAPEMTLNSDAMYLRAQYTYEMMTNTVKFISAIDVNECTEYGFVINGEVVKCEEAAETVDGYDANYLFGGSVNGAMLMSCNMLLDGLVDGMTLNVTPYYVALDGTTVVYGETRTLVYRQWVGLEG